MPKSDLSTLLTKAGFIRRGRDRRRRNDRFMGSGWSSSPGEFHPETLTEPRLNLSIHTALHSRRLLSFESKPSREERAHPEHPVGRTLRRATSSSSLPVYCRRFNATIGSSAILKCIDISFSWVPLIGFLLASLEDFPCSANRLLGKLRPPLMRDAAPPVNRSRRSLYRSSSHAAVLTSSHSFRHFNSGSLAVLFSPDT